MIRIEFLILFIEIFHGHKLLFRLRANMHRLLFSKYIISINEFLFSSAFFWNDLAPATLGDGIITSSNAGTNFKASFCCRIRFDQPRNAYYITCIFFLPDSQMNKKTQLLWFTSVPRETLEWGRHDGPQNISYAKLCRSWKAHSQKNCTQFKTKNE